AEQARRQRSRRTRPHRATARPTARRGAQRDAPRSTSGREPPRPGGTARAVVAGADLASVTGRLRPGQPPVICAVAYDDEPAVPEIPGIEGGIVARAKQTARSEARRRYRQASSQPVEGDAAE